VTGPVVVPFDRHHYHRTGELSATMCYAAASPIRTFVLRLLHATVKPRSQG
jgi:hypothetical protein